LHAGAARLAPWPGAAATRHLQSRQRTHPGAGGLRAPRRIGSRVHGLAAR
jgi:hypothetical protein